jgi:DNA-binding beta-propeller fold protein YncE
MRRPIRLSVSAAAAAGTLIALSLTGAGSAGAAGTAVRAPAVQGRPVPVTAYVASRAARTVTPINTATGKPGKAIKVGKFPYAIVITPNGKTAYVASRAAGTVTPIRTATGKPGKAIRVGPGPARDRDHPRTGRPPTSSTMAGYT